VDSQAPPDDLTDVEQRVLGSLLEKQVTVPSTYPLTLKALRSACNQTSSREPVLDLDEPTVERTCRSLRDRGLLRVVWADVGRRILKYHQLLDEVLGLAADERALLTVLLLRGAQAPGELRTRTERLHPFADREAVEEVLRRLAGRDAPLVRQLGRRAGQHDQRWVHLLGPVPDAASAPAPVAAADDREAVLADGGGPARDERVRATYAAVADAYADATAGELDARPFERWLLDRVAATARDLDRPVVDAGCGAGHVTAHLAAAGVDARGIDLSPPLVERARARHPGVRYEIGDLRALIRPEAADGWAAVLGWYSLVHLAGSELPAAVAALARPLAPGGLLVLAGHARGAGQDGVRQVTSWFGQDVELGFVRWDVPDVVAAVEAAGLTGVEWYHRGPLTGLGESSERLYVLARHP
jgi:uncharacterized protein